MKTLIPLLLLVGVQGSEVARPEPGEPAPAFELAATDGETVRLADLRGRTVVLAFFPKAFTGG